MLRHAVQPDAHVTGRCARLGDPDGRGLLHGCATIAGGNGGYESPGAGIAAALRALRLEPMDIVTISEEARVKAIALRETEGRPADAVLRVGVQGGGCSGFQYLLEYDERRDDDHVLELDGLTVVIDPFSAPLLARHRARVRRRPRRQGLRVPQPAGRGRLWLRPLLPGQPRSPRGARLALRCAPRSGAGGIFGACCWPRSRARPTRSSSIWAARAALVRDPAGDRDPRRDPRHAPSARAAGARSGDRRRGRRVGRAVRRRGRAALPRRHRLVGVLGAPREHPADPAGRPRHLRRDPRRRARRRDRRAPRGRAAARDPRLRRARAPRSRRRSAASATTPTRSSSAARRACRGASRSTPRTGPPQYLTTRRSTRRSSTSRSGTCS